MDAVMEATVERPCCAPVEPMMLQEEPVKATPETVTTQTAVPVAEAPVQMEKPVKVAVKPEGSMTILLFKTPTCPNCKAAGAILDRAGVAYEALNANEEKELVKKYGVKQAPTLVLDNGETFEKYRGVSDIKGWLMHK